MFVDAPTTENLEKRYGAFGEWGMATGIVEILVVVIGLDVD